MLKSLDIKNFTVFANASIEFSLGLNVIIGDNATGKSHLLKLGYSVMHTLAKPGKKNTLADKLYSVFKPNVKTKNFSDKFKSTSVIFLQKACYRFAATLQFV